MSLNTYDDINDHRSMTLVPVGEMEMPSSLLSTASDQVTTCLDKSGIVRGSLNTADFICYKAKLAVLAQRSPNCP